MNGYIPVSASNMSSMANMTAAYFSKGAYAAAPHLGFSAPAPHTFPMATMGYIGGTLGDCQQAGLTWNAAAPPR